MTQELKTTETAIPPYPLHGGRIIGRILAEHGIKHAFGVQGGHVHALETGFYEFGVRRIHCRHEQTGAYAADAYARCTRLPGICYGTAGPGATNMVSGINQAWLVRSPMVALFGQHPREQNIRGPLQEGDGVEVCRTMSKWGAFIDEWRMIPLYLRKALSDCRTYPPGPVVLAMDPKTIRGPGQEKDLVGDIPRSQRAAPEPAAGNPAAVEKAVRMLLEAERPALVAGDGVYWSDAGAELLELAELLQIPVNTRRLARGAVPERHPLSIMAAWRLQFWGEADVIMGIGVKLTNLENFGEPPSWPAKAKRIIVHESIPDAWAAVPSELEIIGSPKVVLRQMMECAQSLIRERPRRTAWLERLAKVRENYERGVDEAVGEVREHKPVHGFFMGKEIADFLGPSTTLIFDSYGGSSHLSDKFKASFAGQVLDSGEAAGVGHGIGMGIGAQLARPGKPVFVMMGDGGMGVGGMDIETAVRYNLPVVYAIYNNSTWMGGVEDLYFQGVMDSWHNLPDIRYDKMFEVLGCHGECVTEPQQLRPALERAFNSGKTAVVNIIADRRVIRQFQVSDAYRKNCLSIIDVAKLPELNREFLLKGLTPEVEEKLRQAGWPLLRIKSRASRFGS